MRCFILLLLAVATWNFGSLTLEAAAAAMQSPLLSRPIRGGVSEGIYNELVHFAKYSSAVYQFICPRPLGNTLVESVRPFTPARPPTAALLTPVSTVLEHPHARTRARRA